MTQHQRRRTSRGNKRRRSRTPSPPAAIPAPRERKPLAEMTAQERADWYASQQAELEDFCSYAQEWAKGRARRAIHTWHDDRYQQFFSQAADLLRGLEELRQEATAQHREEEEDNTHP